MKGVHSTFSLKAEKVKLQDTVNSRNQIEDTNVYMIRPVPLLGDMENHMVPWVPFGWVLVLSLTFHNPANGCLGL